MDCEIREEKKISGVTQNDNCQIIERRKHEVILNRVEDPISTICKLNAEDLFLCFNIQ